MIDIKEIIEIACRAGAAIMEFYNKDHAVIYKEDNSPLTIADRVANEIIDSGLKALYKDIPLVSEENDIPSYEERKRWGLFWLVDPLDGTKEFIKRKGGFTVNIALIERDHPVAGIVYAPARERLYYAMQGKGAWRKIHAGEDTRIHTNKSIYDEGVTVVASLSHLSKDDETFIKGLNVKECISFGSSLKFCAVAEGAADIYPRFSPTWEWDTAAGHCILEEAGGIVVEKTGAPLRYNKPIMKNDRFIALRSDLQFILS